MKTNVTYKIISSGKLTYISEYWDDLLVFRWLVHSPYRGGDINEFLTRNTSIRVPQFEGLNEYHRRNFILDFY